MVRVLAGDTKRSQVRLPAIPLSGNNLGQVVHTHTCLCHQGPVWARGRWRISPRRFLAECCKRQLNQGSFVLLYFRSSTFSDLYWVCLSVFSCTVLLVSISQVICCEDCLRNDLYCHTVSSGALNSTPTNQPTNSVTKQYNLVPVKGRWCPAAGKVTVGLSLHWPCVTDFSGLSSYGLTA